MTGQIFRVTIAGILGGIVLFAIPFLLLKALFFFLFLGLLFRIFAVHRLRRWGHYQRFHSGYHGLRPYESKEGLKDRFNQTPQNI